MPVAEVAPPLESWGLVVAGARSLRGGALAGFGPGRLAWDRWRLHLGRTVGPFTAGRAPVWLVLLVLSLVEARLFGGGRSR